MKRIHFLIAMILAVMISCNDEDPAPAPTRIQILTSQTWRIQAAELDGVPQVIGPCYDDDEINFFENGEMRWRHNAFKCSPSQPNTEILPWEFKNDETGFLLEYDLGEVEFEIIELSSEVFHIESSGLNSQVIIFEAREDQ